MGSRKITNSLIQRICTCQGSKLILVVVIAFVLSCIMLSNPHNPVQDFEWVLRNGTKITYEQENRGLIKFIQDSYIEPPSNEPYNLTNKVERNEDDPSNWQRREVYNLLREMKNGTFVECGAHDGEFLSNTLVLEKLYGWTGALIEGNPKNYEMLKSKHRKAWTLPLCLSPYTYPKKMKFTLEETWSKVIEDPDKKIKNAVLIQCFPLYLVLLALNITKIDYFSLDIEGSELDVLKTVPWDKVDITVFTVEFDHVKEGKEAIRNYMESHGYETYLDGAIMPGGQNVDYVFAKHSFMKFLGKNNRKI